MAATAAPAPPYPGAGAVRVGPRAGDRVALVAHAAAQRPDGAQERARVRRPLPRVPAGGGAHQLVEGGRDAPDVGADGRHFLVDVLVRHGQRGVPAVRLPRAEHLPQHHAGRVHVGAGVGDAAGDLFRRDVRDGPDDQARPGVPGRRLRPGQPEVHDLDPPVGGQQHVLRLDVPVHDPCLVRGGQPGQRRVHDLERLAPGQPAPLAQQAAQRPPWHVLHRQVQELPVRALVEDLHDVGVGQPRDRLGLADEPGHEVGVPRELRVHHLERHLPLEPRVRGEVHGGHAAVRDARADVVPAVKHPADKRVSEDRFHHRRFYVQRRTRRLLIALSERLLRMLPSLSRRRLPLS